VTWRGDRSVLKKQAHCYIFDSCCGIFSLGYRLIWLDYSHVPIVLAQLKRDAFEVMAKHKLCFASPSIHAVNMSNLADQIREALSMFVRAGTKPALIGGLAVVAHQVVRATTDVDFLLESEAADKVHIALLDLGYQCAHRSEDAANYVRAAQGLDLIYAHRPLARRLLAQALVRETPMGQMRIISVEGLIGFKLQGLVNDRSRTRDLDDIRALFKVHRASLDKEELREYFALFDRLELLNELLS
jgi:hypothetical protein